MGCDQSTAAPPGVEQTDGATNAEQATAGGTGEDESVSNGSRDDAGQSQRTAKSQAEPWNPFWSMPFKDTKNTSQLGMCVLVKKFEVVFEWRRQTLEKVRGIPLSFANSIVHFH